MSEASETSTPENILDRGTASGQSPTITIDSMAAVHELCVHKGHIDNCQDLSAFFIRLVDDKSFGYCEAYLLFDDYSTISLERPYEATKNGMKTF